MNKVAYAIYNESDRVLTFHYDELLRHRSNDGVNIFASIEDGGWRAYAKSIEKVVFNDSFAEYDGIESTMKWFMDCTNLKEILGIKNLKTDNVVNMSGMFWNCSSLESLDLSSFNTQKVHSMGFMFSGCKSLTKLDVSNFETKNVTFMGDMFSICSSLKELDLSNFHTEKVQYMSGMFKNDILLKNLDISSFNVDNVKSMNEMFANCPLPRGVDWIALPPKNQKNKSNNLKKSIMGKRLHVVKRQREYGCTEAFNWCFDKFRKLLDVLGCNVCADDESSVFWEMTKDEYKRAITILKMMKDVPVDGDYKEQKEKIDQIYNSEKYQELFSNDECILSITTDDIELHDVIDSVKNIDIDLDELISIMESFLNEADKKSNWIQFEAW